MLSKEYEPMKMKQFSTKIITQYAEGNGERTFSFLPNGLACGHWTSQRNGLMLNTIFDKNGNSIHQFFNRFDPGVVVPRLSLDCFGRKENNWIILKFGRPNSMLMINSNRHFSISTKKCECGFFHVYRLWNLNSLWLVLSKKCPNTIKTINTPLEKSFNKNDFERDMRSLRTKVVMFAKKVKDSL
jgi:hypothetical protein